MTTATCSASGSAHSSSHPLSYSSAAHSSPSSHPSQSSSHPLSYSSAACSSSSCSYPRVFSSSCGATSSTAAPSSASAAPADPRIGDAFNRVRSALDAAKKHYEDPRDLESMEDPVITIKCGHSLNRTVAIDIERHALATGRGFACPLHDLELLNREQVQANSLLGPAGRIDWYTTNFALRGIAQALPHAERELLGCQRFIEQEIENERRARAEERAFLETHLRSIKSENADLGSKIGSLKTKISLNDEQLQGALAESHATAMRAQEALATANRAKDESQASLEALRRRHQDALEENDRLRAEVARAAVREVLIPAPVSTDTSSRSSHPLDWIANQLEPLAKPGVPGNLIAETFLKCINDLRGGN